MVHYPKNNDIYFLIFHSSSFPDIIYNLVRPSHKKYIFLDSSFTSSCAVIQRASEASEADSQSCSIEISDIYIYIYICRYVCVRQKISPALLIT